jgi:hypothetical protein
MAVYSDSLPSMHLTGDDLKEIEGILREDSTNPDFTFTISDGGFTYSLTSTEDFVDKADYPDKATEYVMKMKCEEGKISINGNNTFSGGNLRITGEADWVHKKKRQLASALNSKKNFLRTYSTKIIGGLYAVEVLGWLYFSFLSAGSSTEVSVSAIEAALAVGVFVVGIGWPYALIPLIQFIYPYHLIKKDMTIHYRPKISELGKYVLVLLSLIGGVGGIVTLIRFIS